MGFFKLLLLVNTASKGTTMLGGGNVRLLEILKRSLQKAKITCMTSVMGKQFFEKELPKINYITTPPIFVEFTILPGFVLQTLYALWALRRKKFDAIYSSSDFFPDVIPAYFYKNEKNRWVQAVFHIYPHWTKRPGNPLVNFGGYYLQKFSLALIKQRADAIIVINTLVRDELVKRGFDGQKILTSSCAIDFPYISRVPPSKTGFDGIFMARLNTSKGLLDLPQIWKWVCEKRPNAKLGIIGEGDPALKKMLMQEMEKNGLENNVQLLGPQKRRDAMALLKASKVYLFPSHEEGWGISVAEAMACGLPVVSWNLPVFKEVYEDYTIQVKENDINAFAEKTVELLKNDKKRLQFGKRGARFVKKYAWGELAREEEQAIIQAYCKPRKSFGI